MESTYPVFDLVFSENTHSTLPSMEPCLHSVLREFLPHYPQNLHDVIESYFTPYTFEATAKYMYVPRKAVHYSTVDMAHQSTMLQYINHEGRYMVAPHLLDYPLTQHYQIAKDNRYIVFVSTFPETCKCGNMSVVFITVINYITDMVYPYSLQSLYPVKRVDARTQTLGAGGFYCLSVCVITDQDTQWARMTMLDYGTISPKDAIMTKH